MIYSILTMAKFRYWIFLLPVVCVHYCSARFRIFQISIMSARESNLLTWRMVGSGREENEFVRKRNFQLEAWSWTLPICLSFTHSVQLYAQCRACKHWKFSLHGNFTIQTQKRATSNNEDCCGGKTLCTFGMKSFVQNSNIPRATIYLFLLSSELYETLHNIRFCVLCFLRHITLCTSSVGCSRIAPKVEALPRRHTKINII